MRVIPLTVLLGAVACAGSTAHRETDWQPLFNGKDLTGWRANVMPEAFSVVDGTIRVNAPRESAHLFYIGDGDERSARFKNFELRAMARAEGTANSGIYIHTDTAAANPKKHLEKGYEIQLNNTQRESKKTGSLYAIVDLDRSPVDDTQWFRVHILVQDKRIVVRINDQLVVDYTEPENVQRPPERAGRRLNPLGGQIALQAHDPSSVYYFKDISVRRLP